MLDRVHSLFECSIGWERVPTYSTVWSGVHRIPLLCIFNGTWCRIEEWFRLGCRWVIGNLVAVGFRRNSHTHTHIYVSWWFTRCLQWFFNVGQWLSMLPDVAINMIRLYSHYSWFTKWTCRYLNHGFFVQEIRLDSCARATLNAARITHQMWVLGNCPWDRNEHTPGSELRRRIRTRASIRKVSFFKIGTRATQSNDKKPIKRKNRLLGELVSKHFHSRNTFPSIPKRLLTLWKL